jgi:hypothetical protein
LIYELLKATFQHAILRGVKRSPESVYGPSTFRR